MVISSERVDYFIIFDGSLNLRYLYIEVNNRNTKSIRQWHKVQDLLMEGFEPGMADRES